jgi:hypothetical protein
MSDMSNMSNMSKKPFYQAELTSSGFTGIALCVVLAILASIIYAIVVGKSKPEWAYDKVQQKFKMGNVIGYAILVIVCTIPVGLGITYAIVSKK